MTDDQFSKTIDPRVQRDYWKRRALKAEAVVDQVRNLADEDNTEMAEFWIGNERVMLEVVKARHLREALGRSTAGAMLDAVEAEQRAELAESTLDVTFDRTIGRGAWCDEHKRHHRSRHMFHLTETGAPVVVDLCDEPATRHPQVRRNGV